jgi:tRNA modification GTPase
VEIQAHGSRCGLSKILEMLCARSDVRLADPGEFTKRAFLNGRIDLTQAEAVAELISSQTTPGHELAARQLQGALRRQVEAMHHQAEQLLINIEVGIDFPEDVEDIYQPEILSGRLASAVIEPLKHLLASYEDGHVYRDGVSAIIIGKPNVGKSSLMNCLLQKERAIVTTFPGTTRDFIEETVSMGGVPFRLIDTAGLRRTDDDLEAVGIRLTRRELQAADVVLFVIDGSQPLTAEDSDIYADIRDREVILVINKSDLPSHTPTEELTDRFPARAAVCTSALLGDGIDGLKDDVWSVVTGRSGPAELPDVVPNLRQKQLLQRALTAARLARDALAADAAPELVAVDLRESLNCLGEVIGTQTSDRILDRIFEQFCIGK